MSLAVRVKYLEERWAYFLAFGLLPLMGLYHILDCSDLIFTLLGLPITAICVSGNSLANTAIFALIFPAVRLSIPQILYID
jgi:etoposide-induced 2.4 mRNA